MKAYQIDLEVAGDDSAILLRIVSTLHRRCAEIQYLKFDGTRITGHILAGVSEPTLRESMRRIIGVLSVQVAPAAVIPGAEVRR